MKKKKIRAENMFIWGALLLPAGIAGGVFCFFMLLIKAIVMVCSFLFLLLFGLSSLVCAGLWRNYHHFLL